MQLSTGEARKIFRKLEVEPKRSTHHEAGWFVVDGQRVLPLHYSRGNKDMPGHVPDKFRKSLRLSTREFTDLKKCPLSREMYVELLRERGYLK